MNAKKAFIISLFAANPSTTHFMIGVQHAPRAQPTMTNYTGSAYTANLATFNSLPVGETRSDTATVNGVPCTIRFTRKLDMSTKIDLWSVTRS